jgi:hypothetical protein
MDKHGGNMDVHPWWKHGCAIMEGSGMDIHGGNMDRT